MLIVEDDEATRRALRRIFSRMGWTVRSTEGVEGALWYLDMERAPDAMILDLMLGDGRGEVVIERVRERGLDTRVVVCTGVISMSRLQALGAYRPAAVLPKSMRLGELWDGLLAACEGTTDDPAADGTVETATICASRYQRP
jgi:DNA-binding NtrC family response regulator